MLLARCSLRQAHRSASVNVAVAATDGRRNATCRHSSSLPARSHGHDAAAHARPRARHRSGAAEGDAQLGFRDQRRRPGAHGYRVRTKGPDRIARRRGPCRAPARSSSAAFRSTRPTSTRSSRPTPVATAGQSIRLVRLNDTTPPSTADRREPGFIASSHAVSSPGSRAPTTSRSTTTRSCATACRWAPPTPPIFTDPSPGQHAQLSYVVRAVDTNGNETDSDARNDHDARLDAADRARS